MHTIQHIPLNKLISSASNVRKTNREAGIEELAASIAAHGLLQSLSVRAASNGHAGKFEVIGGGRRHAALKLLAKRKTLPKNTSVPCIVAEGGEAEELSLAENVVRENLHPADQYEAFARLEAQGQGAEDIAAHFGVGAKIVKQRLKLGSVSPKLMQLYRNGDLSLDQLMAFTVIGDHARQEEAWESLSWNKSPEAIRKSLTAAHVAAQDKRALFVGIDAYEAAGGIVARDLFTEHDSGYLADVPLLHRLAQEKLDAHKPEILAEGWKWAEVHIDFPHGHGMGRFYPSEMPLSAEDADRLQALKEEHDRLEAEHMDEEMSEAVSDRVDAIETEIEAIEETRLVFTSEEKARSGVFLTIGHGGRLEMVCGLVRPEDEPIDTEEGAVADIVEEGSAGAISSETGIASSADEEEAGGTGLSAALTTELFGHRTAALADCLAQQPDIALSALVHALALQTFYAMDKNHSCLRISVHRATFAYQIPGVAEGIAAQNVGQCHAQWASILPKSAAALWTFICTMKAEQLLELLAYCVGQTVVAAELGRETPSPGADEVAKALGLDMAAYWTPTVASYLGRVTKARILSAVREGVSEEAADRIAGLKKGPMADAANELLKGRGWLPSILKTGTGPGEGECV